MKKREPPESQSASELIDERVRKLNDWRGETLGRIRALVKEADPDVIEEWKWRGVPVWSDDGMICTGETYIGVVKMTFAKGAALDDPSALFNSSLDGNTRRAIDFREGETIDEEALKALIRAAAALNKANAGSRSTGRARRLAESPTSNLAIEPERRAAGRGQLGEASWEGAAELSSQRGTGHWSGRKPARPAGAEVDRK